MLTYLSMCFRREVVKQTVATQIPFCITSPPCLVNFLPATVDALSEAWDRGFQCYSKQGCLPAAFCVEMSSTGLQYGKRPRLVEPQTVIIK